MSNLSIRNEQQPTAPERFDPFQTMRELLRFDPFTDLYRFGGERLASTFNPSFDVRETADAIVLTADMPGVKEGDLDIQLTNNRLTITGKRESEQEVKGETYYRAERSWGSFARTFTLPTEIDANKVSADLKNGVLTVQLPRLAAVQPKKISVKPASSAKA